MNKEKQAEFTRIANDLSAMSSAIVLFVDGVGPRPNYFDLDKILSDYVGVCNSLADDD